jgi:hypothetical protein
MSSFLNLHICHSFFFLLLWGIFFSQNQGIGLFGINELGFEGKQIFIRIDQNVAMMRLMRCGAFASREEFIKSVMQNASSF